MMSYGGGGYGYNVGGFNPMQGMGGRPPWEEEDPFAPRPGDPMRTGGGPGVTGAPPVPPPQMARRSVGIGRQLSDYATGSPQYAGGAQGGGQARGMIGSVGDALKGAARGAVGGVRDMWGGMDSEAKASTLLGLVGTGADIYGARQDRQRADEQERYIREQEAEERERRSQWSTAIGPMLQQYLQRGNR